MVTVEVRGQVVRLSRLQAERLRTRAAAEAGLSARARDLALVLDWALASPRTVVLRRGESNEFLRLIRDDDEFAGILSQLAA